MEGIAYVTDDRGRRTAVLVDLNTWGDSWEDIEDFLVSRSRKGEPALAWADVKRAIADEAGAGCLTNGSPSPDRPPRN